MNKIGELVHCNRHTNCNHHGPKTEFAKKGLKNASQGIYVTYQHLKNTQILGLNIDLLNDFINVVVLCAAQK